MGTITRGTTGPNRLRRADRWLVATHARMLTAVGDPLVVDLGYGAHARTTVELADRLRQVVGGVEVVGIEIDPARVAAARAYERPGLSFRRGGFEIPLDGRRAHVIRAFNVLRQYAADEVPDAWTMMRGRLAPGGVLVDGTCDEIGRRCTWVSVAAEGPTTFTLSVRLRGLDRPGVVAERLPKVLIHRNVPGEPVHRLLHDLDDCWVRAAGHAAYGERQRFVAAVTALRARGWSVGAGPPRWRLGEVSVPWSEIAPT